MCLKKDIIFWVGLTRKKKRWRDVIFEHWLKESSALACRVALFVHGEAAPYKWWRYAIAKCLG